MKHCNFYKDGRTSRILADDTLKKLYTIWIGIRRREFGRCFADDDRHKNTYKTIAVCDEWKDWNAFSDWALNNGYVAGLSIDRIDNALGYCPANCRWVTKEENNRNRQIVKKYWWLGELKTLGQICEMSGVDYKMAKARIDRGWEICSAIYTQKNQTTKEKVNVTKTRNMNMQKDYDSGMSIRQLSEKYKMGERNVYDCIRVRKNRLFNP